MKVLLVDDDALWRRSTRRTLPRFSVDEAQHAREALFAAKSNRYDVVILDVCLDAGGPSGADVATTLRGEQYDGAIVLVSGVVGTRLEEISVSAGADAWLNKCDVAGYRLRRVIEETVARRARTRSVSARGCLPTAIAALLGDVLDAAANERDAHAERSYRLALLALEIARSTSDPAWRTLCADAVGLGPELLRQYAFTASRWPRDELRDLLRSGLSMSHLKEVAALPREARSRWVSICRERELTVLELKDAMCADTLCADAAALCDASFAVPPGEGRQR